MRYSGRIARIPVLLGCAVLLAWSAQTYAEAKSSCEQCHLDEDMIAGSLAKVKGKKSAKQSGAG